MVDLTADAGTVTSDDLIVVGQNDSLTVPATTTFVSNDDIINRGTTTVDGTLTIFTLLKDNGKLQGVGTINDGSPENHSDAVLEIKKYTAAAHTPKTWTNECDINNYGLIHCNAETVINKKTITCYAGSKTDFLDRVKKIVNEGQIIIKKGAGLKLNIAVEGNPIIYE